ncbi:hypothetical protein P3S67_005978 [Capsicum chacoense]
MDCVKLVLFFMLYPFLCQLAFPSSLPHLYPKHQALALLQFRQMFTINSNASDDFCYNPKTLSWNRRTDCCSWNGVYCDKITGQLSSLKQLFNSGFTGLIPAEISHISRLQFLTISTVDPYGLRLGLYNFQLLLKNMTQLRYLDLEYVNISSTITERDLTNLTNLEYLRLSYNSLTGPIPSNWKNPGVQIENIGCHFCKPKSVARSYSKVTPDKQDLQFLTLSQNNFSRQIPSAVCYLKTLIMLDLGSNNLNGIIPQCLGEMSDLEVLGLNNNILSGTINTTFSTENQLRNINLYGNKLKGKVPPSLINCRNLEFLDLGNNELNDTFPSWLGGLPGLKILSLRSNKLHGPISDSRTENLFPKIRVIDLSSNGFSGNLPVSLFENFQAIKKISENSGTREYIAGDYSGNYANILIVTTKGLDQELPRHIPSIIGDLVGLHMLNLSHNGLEGIIPASLHQLSVLESLDLSSNKIGGEIPQQPVSLIFLAVLNLSHNHLVGCIPKGKQFDTFENSSYQGNDGLRGFPLTKDCGGNDGVPQPITPVELDDDEEEEGDLIS